MTSRSVHYCFKPDARDSLSARLDATGRDTQPTRYHCKGCDKKFTTLNGLQQHLRSTGCSAYSERLTSVLVRDASSAQPLMLTDRAAISVLKPEAVLRFDGACQPNPGWGGAGFVIKDGYTGRQLGSGSRSTGWSTNNQSEYHGMIDGMERAHALGIRRLAVEGDSELVVKQMNGVYRTHDSSLQQLNGFASKLELMFQTVTFRHIPRRDNYEADALAKDGVDL